MMAIRKTTDITIIAVHPTSNKTETTETNNHLDIVTERTTSPGIVKPVLFAEDRHMSRECRVPRQNQNSRQQNSNVN